MTGANPKARRDPAHTMERRTFRPHSGVSLGIGVDQFMQVNKAGRERLLAAHGMSMEQMRMNEGLKQVAAVPAKRASGPEYEFDAVIVGAGVAGLSAALILGRSRRRVLVLDGGMPRNAPAAGAHNFLSRDGVSPTELLRIGREQLTPYESVEVRAVTATAASGTDGRFVVRLADGSEARARKLVLATGVVDELPDRPGFAELWGRGVYHCPYCHGWEVRDRPLAVLNASEMAMAQVMLIRNLSRDLALLTDGPASLSEEERRMLSALGVPVHEQRIARLEGRADGGEGLARIHFEDGSTLAREGLFFAPPQRQRSGLAAALGCEMGAMGLLPEAVKTDPMSMATSVPGVYVAGDAGAMLQSIVMAAAAGTSAGAFLNHALSAEDAAADAASAGYAVGSETTDASTSSEAA